MTDFGPRLPELLREAEVEHFFVRRGRGELVHTVTISWSASPSGDDPDRSILADAAALRPTKIESAELCEVVQRLSIEITCAATADR